jgi:hypothetical protein
MDVRREASQVGTAYQLPGAIVSDLHNVPLDVRRDCSWLAQCQKNATSCADPSYKCTTLWEARLAAILPG